MLTKIHIAQYNPQTDMNTADIKSFAYPNAVSRKLGLLANHIQYTAQPDLYSDLKRVGFLLEQDDDLTRHICERLGGHYMDIGASKKIADGLVCFYSPLITGYGKNSLTDQ